MADDILDPAHDPNADLPAQVAGRPDPEPGADTDRVTPDGNIIERDGKKYIVMDALTTERAEKQRLAGTLAQLEPLIPEFEEFMRQREHRGRATVDRAAANGESDYTPDELDGYAISRGYYKDDGVTPDTSRAQKELDIVAGINRRQIRREVEPVARGTLHDRANTNRAAARTRQFVDGRPVAEPAYIDAALNALGDEHLADPNVANIAQVVAAGLEYLDLRKSGKLARGSHRGEPMYLERGTGRFDGDPGRLSPLEEAAARARGKTPEQWRKISKAIDSSAVLEGVD